MNHTTTFCNVNYTRVLPRDLFNEAKLLKCIGRLCLLIHNDSVLPCKMEFIDNGDPFRIGLMDEGALTISNLKFYIKGQPIVFKTGYNSKDNYPLRCEKDYCDYLVFDESGNFDTEFLDFVNTL